MKYNILFFFLLISSIAFSQKEKLDKIKTENIQKVITLFQTKNIDGISEIVNYPLHREYPIPDVKNETDLKKRFNQIFDVKIINQISNSKTDQWSEIGWRGIMFSDGDVWINENGKIIAVNYQSDFENNQYKSLIANDRKDLYPTLKDFRIPVYKFRTKNYLIRIDQLENGSHRYAAWKLAKKNLQNPI